MKKIVLLISLIVLAGCSDSSKPNVELIQDMMVSPALKAQEGVDGKLSMRVPPKGTVPVGFKPYPYKGKPEVAGRRLVNPLAGKATPEILKTGRKYYETYCSVCHGNTGKGDGPVAVKFPLKPPPLISKKTKDFSDGRIYHIISDGQGIMQNYASQVPQKYRWYIVNYIRDLQKRY